MALITWIGGTHDVTDPGAWVPNTPASGDFASVPAGHVLAINQTLGNYILSLDGGPSTSTFDSVGSTITGGLGGFIDELDSPGTAGNGNGTAVFLGQSFNQGVLGTEGDYLAESAPTLKIVIGDVTSSAGAVIEQGVLVNTGTITAGDTGEPVTVDSPSADATLANDGSIEDYSAMTIDVPVTGTGSIVLDPGPRDIGFDIGGITFGAAVSSGQTVDVQDGFLKLTNPLSFRATVNLEPALESEIEFSQQITSALLVNHDLSLLDGSTLVAQIKLVDGITAGDLVVNSGPSGTMIGRYIAPPFPGGVSEGNIPVGTAGTAPTAPPLVLPSGVEKLPSSGPNLTLTSGAKVASIEELNGYIAKLDGATAAAAPSLNESSVVFGANFALEATGFGGLAAVGYNANDGTVEALGGATLAVGVTDVTSPTDGVTILGGAFNNAGTIEAAAGGTIEITGSADSKLINAGNVVADGMVFIGPTITGTGTMTVGSSGSLELGGYVATGQAIDLPAGTLTIDTAHEFFATIFDFGPSGTIVLKGVDVSGITYDNGALLLDGGTDGTLHLHRPAGASFTTQSFQLAHAGGSTSITVVG